MLIRLALALLLALPLAAHAQNSTPRVLMDTSHGPILIELDGVHTPRHTANFLAYVDAGRYNNTLMQRVAKDFVVQGGALRADFTAFPTFPNIDSERSNAGRLSNVRGTLAMALTWNNNGGYSVNTANSDFFFNVRDNSSTLNEHFTAFGRIVFGLGALDSMSNLPLLDVQSQLPVVSPVIRKVVRTSAFPILPLHTGAWYDPQKAGRGFNIEVSTAAPGSSDLLLVVYWYDFKDGEQVWMSGVAPFALGANQVVVPMQISTGGQFGPAFDPAQVQSSPNWGQLTVRFTACDRAFLSYTSEFGNGEFNLQRLTIPSGSSCVGG